MDENGKIKQLVTAVLTPIDSQGNPDSLRLEKHIHHLGQNGSNAILLAGTTGEGPSFNVSEREKILESGLKAAGNMEVIAQTGCASLSDTINLTRHAFGLGVQQVTIMPPFFFNQISDEGLYAYYSRIMDDAIPSSGKLILYHIPQITHIQITVELVERLLGKYGDRIAGIKDSAGDINHLRDYCDRFPQLLIFTGNDHLILEALRSGAAGCVTGVVNVFTSMASDILKAYSQNESDAEIYQQKFTTVWKVLKDFQPYTTHLKALCALYHKDSGWLRVLPPLSPMVFNSFKNMISQLRMIDNLPKNYDWIQSTDLAYFMKEETGL